MMMMFAPNSLVRQKEGAHGEEEEKAGGGGSEGGGRRGGRSKKVKTDRNSDARRRRSHRSNSVRGVGCEEQEKTWTKRTKHGVID